jgi:hypothetical protein
MNLPGPISFLEVFIAVILIAGVLTIAIAALVVVLRRRHSPVVKFEPMHVHELIKLIVSLASFVTVCITLFLLVLQNRTIGMQTRFNLQSVESSVFGTVTNQSLASDEMFVRYPELRPYFYAGKNLEEGDPRADQVKALAEYYLDYFQSLSTQLQKYPNLWRYEKREWEANIIDMFAWSPVLCRYLETNRGWFNEELVALKQAGELKRRQGQARQLD